MNERMKSIQDKMNKQVKEINASKDEMVISRLAAKLVGLGKELSKEALKESKIKQKQKRMVRQDG